MVKSEGILNRKRAVDQLHGRNGHCSVENRSLFKWSRGTCAGSLLAAQFSREVKT
jgi:hypothetical protein